MLVSPTLLSGSLTDATMRDQYLKALRTPQVDSSECETSISRLKETSELESSCWGSNKNYFGKLTKIPSRNQQKFVREFDKDSFGNSTNIIFEKPTKPWMST